MGLVTDVQDHCLSFVTYQFAGQYTITAANGDTVYGTYSGQLASDFSFNGLSWITGGTGRFIGATGVVPARGVMTSGVTVVYFDGTMSSVGSLAGNGH